MACLSLCASSHQTNRTHVYRFIIHRAHTGRAPFINPQESQLGRRRVISKIARNSFGMHERCVTSVLTSFSLHFQVRPHSIPVVRFEKLPVVFFHIWLVYGCLIKQKETIYLFIVSELWLVNLSAYALNHSDNQNDFRSTQNYNHFQWMERVATKFNCHTPHA